MSEKIRKKTSIINNNIVYNYHKLDYNIVKSDAYKRFYKKEGFSINYLDIIKEENIEVTDKCTMCNEKLFFSHRRMGNLRGSMAAYLSLKE